MEFLQSTGGILIVSLLGLVFFCIILYYVIKAAIADALKEAKKGKDTSHTYNPSVPPPTWNAEQIALKNKYEKGEITFEEYTNEWNKL